MKKRKQKHKNLEYVLNVPFKITRITFLVKNISCGRFFSDNSILTCGDIKSGRIFVQLSRQTSVQTHNALSDYNSVIGDRVFFIAIVISQVYSIIVHEIPKIFGRYARIFLLQCALPRPEVIFEQHFLPISLALFNFSSSSLYCLAVANHRELSSHIPDWSAAGLSSRRVSHWSHLHRNQLCRLKVHRQKVLKHNVLGDKTRQNILWTKLPAETTSRGTKRP